MSLFEDLALELQIGPSQRGEMVHSVLEDYVQALLDGSPASPESLQSIMSRVLSEDINPAWLPHLWERDRTAMEQAIVGVIAADQRDADDGWQYLAPEAGFGPHDSRAAYGYQPVPLTLPDGSTISFQGKVDRVDKNSDGRVRITDYKTGKKTRFGNITQDAPTAGGTKFQLPVYGLFAEQFRDNQDSSVEARYWFIGQEQSITGYQVDEAVQEKFRHDVAIVLAGIRAGVFPHIPKDSSFLTYTSVAGKSSVDQTWERLRTDHTIRKFPMLTEATHGK